MKKNMTVSNYAFRTLEATKQQSVIKVYPAAISKIEAILNSHKKGYFVGVKDTDVIPHLFLKTIESKGYIIHTKDAMARDGRAIDLELMNPVTARFMTGSSSGSALNVFYGINDIGIGTDGGGSVLNPALSLNLYAMISKHFQQEAMRKVSKKSTDNIEFTSSLGFITKDLLILKEFLINNELMSGVDNYKVINGLSNHEYYDDLHSIFNQALPYDVQIKQFGYNGLNRNVMIDELSTLDFKNTVLVLSEGPIDLLGYGDSVLGHGGILNLKIQKNGHKYYSKVINMLGLAALVVPSSQHAIGFLLVSEASDAGVAQLIDVAEKLLICASPLIESYFDLNSKYMKEEFK